MKTSQSSAFARHTVAQWWKHVAEGTWEGAEAALALPPNTSRLHVLAEQPSGSRAALLDLLATGTVAPRPARIVGGKLGSEFMGTFFSQSKQAESHLIVGNDALHSAEAVLRSGTEAANEVFAYRAGELVQMDALMAPVAPRKHGVAAVGVVPGRTFFDAGINDGYALEYALRQRRLALEPRASAELIARSARVDRQMIQTFDHVFGQWDRNAGNGLYDAASGQTHIIDNNGLFVFSSNMRQLDWTGAGVIEGPRGTVAVPVLPEVVERWASLDRAALRDARDAIDGVRKVRDPLDTAFRRIDDLVRDQQFVTQGDLADAQRVSARRFAHVDRNSSMQSA